MFGITASAFNQANQAHAVNYIAIALLLQEKGIIDYADLERAHIQATHLVEQEWASKKEAAEECPGAHALFGLE